MIMTVTKKPGPPNDKSNALATRQRRLHGVMQHPRFRAFSFPLFVSSQTKRPHKVAKKTPLVSVDLGTGYYAGANLEMDLSIPSMEK